MHGGQTLQLRARLITGANDADINRPLDRNLACHHAAGCTRAQISDQAPVEQRQRFAVGKPVERDDVAHAAASDPVICLGRRVARGMISGKQDAHPAVFEIAVQARRDHGLPGELMVCGLLEQIDRIPHGEHALHVLVAQQQRHTTLHG